MLLIGLTSIALINKLVVDVNIPHSLSALISIDCEVFDQVKAHLPCKLLSTCIGLQATDIFINISLVLTVCIGSLDKCTKFRLESILFLLIFGEPTRTAYEQLKNAINRRFCYEKAVPLSTVGEWHCFDLKNGLIWIIP